MATERLDQLLVERGLFPSRERAKRTVMAGLVDVDGQRVDKPGTKVGREADLSVRGGAEPFVSRAGRKLDAALDHFLPLHPELDPAGKVCLDVGASTGGFTDCLLKRGAERVFAVDVGYGQLELGLRRDPRVVVMERINARHLAADALGEPVAIATMDLSFISLAKVVPAIVPHLTVGGHLLTLIKPQFEAGRAEVGKGGVVRDPEVRRRVVAETAEAVAGAGLRCLGTVDSAVPGVSGNREAFGLFVRDERPVSDHEETA